MATTNPEDGNKTSPIAEAIEESLKKVLKTFVDNVSITCKGDVQTISLILAIKPKQTDARMLINTITPNEQNTVQTTYHVDITM